MIAERMKKIHDESSSDPKTLELAKEALIFVELWCFVPDIFRVIYSPLLRSVCRHTSCGMQILHLLFNSVRQLTAIK